jgi:hypothetical protein
VGNSIEGSQEKWLTRRPCPQRRSRGGVAHRRPAGVAAEEGGRPVGEVASVCMVLGHDGRALGVMERLTEKVWQWCDEGKHRLNDVFRDR